MLRPKKLTFLADISARGGGAKTKKLLVFVGKNSKCLKCSEVKEYAKTFLEMYVRVKGNL